jgi:hypothetical protein
MRAPILLAVVLPLVGCHAVPAAQPLAPSQPFARAVTMMCDVDKLAGLTSGDDPLALGRQRSAWISDHVDNPDAIELRTLMSVKGAAEQATMLREHAKGAGVLRCALADDLDRTGVGGVVP